MKTALLIFALLVMVAVPSPCLGAPHHRGGHHGGGPDVPPPNDIRYTGEPITPESSTQTSAR